MSSSVPLIRLSAANPFLVELQRRGLSYRAMMNSLGLPACVPASSDLFVPPHLMYRIVEECAEIAGDRHLGFSIGDRIELGSWEPLGTIAPTATTVYELLLRFTMQVAEHSSATSYFLRTDGDRSTFGMRRAAPPEQPPGQNDAFYMGFIRRLFKDAAGTHWDPSKVLFRVADPECLPSLDANMRVAKGDHAGASITFPSNWLLFQLHGRDTTEVRSAAGASSSIPRTRLESLQVALQPHLHERGLSVDRVAELCGHRRGKLLRILREEGTCLTRELARLRAERAKRDLAETDRRIADVGESVGFIDPTAFSRAFKNWTGESPQHYRRSRRPARPESKPTDA